MDSLKALAFFVCVIVAVVVAFIAWFAFRTRPRRPGEPGFEYVFVEDDGTARELDADEQEYLQEKFHPADGARPYIKFRYESRTPDGRIGGYLRRRQLPKRIPVRPIVTGGRWR